MSDEFNPDEDEEELVKQAFIKKIAQQQRMRQLDEERQSIVTDKCTRQSQQIEEKVLVDLWRDLGDNTETYWQAMNAIRVFSKCVLYVQRNCGELPAPLASRLMQALSESIGIQSKMVLETSEAIEKFDASNQVE